MIKYLDDYANIQYISMHNPNLSVGKIFDRYMRENGRLEDCNIEYYDRMRRVYTFYSYFRSFSFVEDYLLNRDDFISNNDLDNLEDNAQIYTNRNGITNKQIVQLMRNAFNHNDDDSFERFKLSVNGKYCEIEFRDIRTDKEKANNVAVKPFRMKFDLDYLIKVNRKISSEKQNALAASFEIPVSFNILSENLYEELQNIKIIRYYFPKKLGRDIVEQLNSYANVSELSKEELEVKSQEFHAYAKEQRHLEGKYSLTNNQIEKIIYMIQQYRKHNSFGDFELKENQNFYMYYFLMRVVPIPLFKYDVYVKHSMIAYNYLLDTNISYHDITERARNICNGVIPLGYDETDIEIHNDLSLGFETYSNKLRFFMNMIDGEFYNIYPIISYIDAVVTHFCTDDKIEINGTIYDREKIRNSFVHGRWYISRDNEIVMYDADPRNVNDYNLEFLGKVRVEDFKKWADKYMNKSCGKKRVLK